MFKIFVAYDIGEGVEPDLTEAHIGVPILGGSFYIFTVVDMEDGDLIFSQNPVELLKDAFGIVYDIVAAVVSMAGIKADPMPCWLR